MEFIIISTGLLVTLGLSLVVLNMLYHIGRSVFRGLRRIFRTTRVKTGRPLTTTSHQQPAVPLNVNNTADTAADSCHQSHRVSGAQQHNDVQPTPSRPIKPALRRRFKEELFFDDHPSQPVATNKQNAKIIDWDQLRRSSKTLTETPSDQHEIQKKVTDHVNSLHQDDKPLNPQNRLSNTYYVKADRKVNEHRANSQVIAPLVRNTAIRTTNNTHSSFYLNSTHQREKAFSSSTYHDSHTIELLDKHNVAFLYHMTHIDNLKGIISHGLQSHNLAHSTSCLIDISMPEVNDLRKRPDPVYKHSLHDYVPLYFNPKNPMLYKRKEIDANIAIIALDRMLIAEQKAIFTDGNAASHKTRFFSDIASLNAIEWNLVWGHYWNNHSDGKRKKCTEVLIPYTVPADRIDLIIVKNQHTLDQIASTVASTVTVEIDRRFFTWH